MSCGTALGGMTDLMSFNELCKQFQNLSDLKDDSNDDNNDAILDKNNNIITMPVAEFAAYNNS